MDWIYNGEIKMSAAQTERSFRTHGGKREGAGRRARHDFRVCVASIQGTHLHLIVEADDRTALARGIRASRSRVRSGSTPSAAGGGIVLGSLSPGPAARPQSETHPHRERLPVVVPSTWLLAV